MLARKKVGKSGVEISEIILGCWVMGGERWGGADDEESIRAIHKAIDLGMNTFDTAEAYNNGYSENIIGRAIKDRGNDVVISSKVGENHMRHDDVIAACERSLKRLGRDHIDIYFLHWPAGYYGGPKASLAETMGAMAELQKAGKIRAIGMSNFSRVEFEEAKKTVRVDIYQPPFNILWRRTSTDLFPYCIENDIAIIPYSPIAQGLLSGKFKPGHIFKEGDSRGTTPLFQSGPMERALALNEKIKPIADKQGKTLAQLAIRWVCQFPGVTAPIAGGRSPAQVEENSGGVGWNLSKEDFDFIEQLSRDYHKQLPKFKHYFDTEIVK
ncbi:oxidoreductase [Spirochaetia bacterium]|nr:oxidoreductase [Spirochaetia bacterium]